MSIRNLNRTQWDAFCEDLAEQLKERWPSLKVSSNILWGVEINTRAMSGSASLRRPEEAEDYYVPVVRIGSSSTYSSDLSLSKEQHAVVKEVLSALSFLEEKVAGVRVCST